MYFSKTLTSITLEKSRTIASVFTQPCNPDIIYVSLSTLYVIEGVKTPRWMRQTAYILLDSFCPGGCKFCELRGPSPARLARVTWYPVNLEKLLEVIDEFQLVCIQTTMTECSNLRLWRLLQALGRVGRKPRIAVNLGITSSDILRQLKRLGVEYIGIGLDAVSPRINRIAAKPSRLLEYMRSLVKTIEVFGKGRVYAHVIVGLGERPAEMLRMIDILAKLGVGIALFAYVPPKRCKAEGLPKVQPDLCYYRAVQLYMTCLELGINPWRYLEVINENIVFRDIPDDELIANAISTKGCPGCNRPFYTESPKGPLYNIPWQPSKTDVENVKVEILKCLKRSYQV